MNRSPHRFTITSMRTITTMLTAITATATMIMSTTMLTPVTSITMTTLSAIMLTLLPIVTFLFLFLVNPTFYLDVAGDPMFATGFIGLIGLYLIGFWMMRRMVDLKV